MFTQAIFSNGFSVGIGVPPPSKDVLASIRYDFTNQIYTQLNTGILSLYGIEIGKIYNQTLIKINYHSSIHSKNRDSSYYEHKIYTALERNILNINQNINLLAELGINYSYDEVSKNSIDGIIASALEIKWDNLKAKIGINLSMKELFNTNNTTIHNYYGDIVFLINYKF